MNQPARTDEDQADFVAMTKRDLAELLNDSRSFVMLDMYSTSQVSAPHCWPLRLLCLYVTSLRAELVRWCEGEELREGKQ